MKMNGYGFKGAFLIAAAFAAGLGRAETLTVPAGTTVEATASASYDALDVQGTLNIRGSGAGAITTITSADNVTLGAGSINVYDFGSFNFNGKSVTFTGASGMLAAGGQRKGTSVPWEDPADSKLYGGNLILAEGATSASGVVDVLRLDAGAVFNRKQNSEKIVNMSSSADMRIRFNGGYMCVNNAYGAQFEFQTSSRTDGLSLVPAGKGGKSIILRSENGNPIDLRYRWGGLYYPIQGSLKTEGAGKMRLWGETGSTHHFGWRMNLAPGWGHTGDFELANNFRIECAGWNVLPYVADGGDVVLAGNSQYNYLDLKGYGQSVNGFISAPNSVLKNTGAALCGFTIGGKRPDGTFCAPKIEGRIAITKVGAGTLTITNTADFASLTVNGGTVRIGRNAKGVLNLGTLALAAGTTLVVDGVRLVVDMDASILSYGATVSCVNGGAIEGVKNGTVSKTLTSTTPFAFARVHVAAGTLDFSAPQSTNHWLRFTFTKISSNWVMQLSELVIMDAAGKRVDGGGSVANLPSTDPCGAGGTGGSAVANAPANAVTASGDASAMPPKSVWSSRQDWQYAEPEGGYRKRSPSCIFDGAAWTYLFINSTISASNPYRLVVRLPAGTGRYAQYNFRTGYSGVNQVSDWTVESSPDGVNWKQVDAHSGVSPSGKNAAWFNDGVHYPLDTGDQDGAGGLAPATPVQVDAGAVLDGSRVTGGQTISDITVDVVTGGGTLRGVALAETGTLRLVNVTDPKAILDYAVPLAFESASGTDHARSWKLYVNGQPVHAKLSWRANGFYVPAQGTLLLMR